MSAKNLLSCRSLLSHRACFILTQKPWIVHSSTTTDGKIKGYDEVPGPKSLPIIKCLWIFAPPFGKYNQSRLDSYYMKLYETYGPVVRFDTPDFIRGKVVFVFDTKLFRQVFGEEGPLPRRPVMSPHIVTYRKTKPHLYPSLGLFFQDGEGWKELRKIASKLMLRVNSVRSHVPIMEGVANDFVDKIRRDRNERMEIDDFIKKLFPWALESLGTFALHRRFGCLDENAHPDSMPRKLITSVGDTFKALSQLEFGPVTNMFFPGREYKKMIKAQNYFADIVRKYLQESTEKLRQRGPSAKGEQHFLLDALLLESGMQMNLVYGILMDLFLAGIDTTSTTSSFLLYWLATHSEKQETLRREIFQIAPDKNAPLTTEQIEAFIYLRHCLQESLRLTPITVGTARILDHDTVLGGYEIPKNTNIAMIFNVTSRLEKYYERPNEFIPERWYRPSRNPEASRRAEAARASAGLTRTYAQDDAFASVPFGHSIRMCLGRRFAEQEILLLFIKIMQNFRVEYRGPPITPILGLVNSPDRPLNLTFRDL